MRIKAFVVIDTNVLVSAMLSNSKSPFVVLELVEKGNLIPIFDKRMLMEHYKNKKPLGTFETILVSSGFIVFILT